MSKKKGLFIVFEGGEGSGKTTQIKLLKDDLELRGFKVVATREPGGTQTGEKIREILKDPTLPKTSLSELLLFNASRNCHVEQKILPAKEAGEVVISDRFYDSTIAYQCGGRGIDYDLVNKINMLAAEKCKPDMVFVLFRDIKKGLNDAKMVSAKEDHFEKEKLDFHERVHNEYKKIVKRDLKNHKIIDGNKSIEEVHQDIIKEVNKLLK